MPLNSREKRELEKQFRRLNSKVCLLKEEDTDIQAELDLKADLVGGVVPTDQLPITQDIIDALNNANAPDGTNYFTTLADLSSITPGTLINVANNYSALPAANTVSGEFYWVENAQGTSWLPGPLGGTYYPNGLYYSNGTTWIFTDMPYNATQVEVDAGLNNNKFVTPQTFTNASKWGTKFDNWTVTTANTGTLTGKNVLWLVDTSAARTRDLDPTGNYAHIKDTTGNASTNNITVNAPVGQTINGNASETIDSDFGWVEYKLVGTDWVTTEGDSGASTNQLIIDSIPTNGSTNPVSSDGVFDALALKQDILTNPVTGTGTAGQVSYWSGTGTQTGSSSLVWDAINNQLNIGGTNVFNHRLFVNGILRVADGNAVTNGSGISGGEGLFLSSVNGLNLFSNSTYALRIFNSTRNIAIQNGGTFTDNGQRLQVYGSTLLRGSGTTSATTALLVQNSTPSALMTVRDDGYTLFGSGNSGTPLATLVDFRGTTDNDYIQVARVSSSSDRYVRIYAGGQIDALSIGTSSPPFTFAAANNPQTSGNRGLFSITNTFNPTSGNATYTSFLINQTINQTGGANGITRGLYVNPTLTAAADWRSIETSNNTGYAVYAGGTADSYFGGRISIGTTLQSQGLRIGRNPTAADSRTIFVNPNIQNTVTSNYVGITTSIGLSTSGFTLPNLAHYEAINDGTHTAGVVTNLFAFREKLGTYSATNVYGFYGDIPSGTGRWNLYMNGTAANYLAGNTSIGTTTSSGRLTVQGSGTTSATTALLVQNSTPTALLQIYDNGRIDQTIPSSTNTTIFGSAAGAAALTGSGNTFIGTSAGNATTTGANNAALGFSSGLSNTTGSNNVFFGSSAGRGNVDGSRNIFIGNAAGRFITDGTTANTKPDDSVFIGSDTRANANTQTNQIVIGYQAIGNGSNTATLGNTSITDTYLRGNINYTDGGNFVIGTTTGTKIGTSTSQKIGLWNATPIVQPTTAVAAATIVGGGGTTVTDTDTFDGYTIAQIVKALRNIGLLA